jgi:hypothetical protein
VTPSQLAIHTDGAVSCGTRLWRFRGSLQLTVVVKAVFAILHDGVAKPAGPGAIISEDYHRDGYPARSVEAASDLAPYLARCDVLFVGHAYALGARAAAGAVRLGISREGRPLLDKTIHVFGNRASSSPAAAGVPAPFTRIPIIYEKALGGPGEPNPVGTDAPNLVDPADARRPVGFGPIGRYWPIRRRLLGKIDGKAIDATVADIPETMPWDYFQAAPPDQQIEHLRGGEWLVLDGLHPTLARVQTRLAATRGAACVVMQGSAPGGPSSPPATVELVCDTLAIDGDRQTLSLSWRGHREVAEGEATLPSLRILAALEVPGVPTDWARILSTGALAPTPPPANLKVDGATASIGPAQFAAIRLKPLPFELRSTPSSAQPAQAARVETPDAAAVGPRPTPIQGVMRSTMGLLGTQQEALASAPATPFRGSGREPVPSAPVFHPLAEISGAPWSSLPAQPVPRLQEAGGLTLVVTPHARSDRFALEVVPDLAPPATEVLRYEPVPPVIAAIALEPVAPPAMIGPLATLEMAETKAVPAEGNIEPATPIAPVAAQPEALHLEAFSIERCAATAASMARRNEDRAQILEENELTPNTWDALVKHWTEEIRKETKRGKTALLETYDHAYVARLEEERGPVRVEDYAQLMVAGERSNAEEALAELTLPRGAMLRIQRVWVRRMVADAALRARVREAMEAARGG